MTLTSLSISHRQAHADYDKRCYFSSFGVKSGKLWVEHYTYEKKRSPNVAVEYDLSNIIQGITYRHAEQSENTLIESMVTHDGKHLEIVLFPTHSDLYAVHFDTITAEYQHKEGQRDEVYTPKRVADHTIIFPAVETLDEWKDRMQRLLAAAAHNLEAALGSFTVQLYTHTHEFLSARRTSTMLNKLTNTGVHCRVQIGYLWREVKKAVSKTLDADVLALYANMQSPQHIKAFFHHHNDTDWQKLRFQHPDTRNIHRRVHLWADDFSAGKLLFDVNAKHTSGGVLDDLEAKAEFHILTTEKYLEAASHNKWLPTSERVY